MASELEALARTLSDAEGRGHAAGQGATPHQAAANRVPGSAGSALSPDLTNLANASPTQRGCCGGIPEPAQSRFQPLSHGPQAQSVARSLLGQVAPDWRERISPMPGGDTNNNAVRRRFAEAFWLRGEPLRVGPVQVSRPRYLHSMRNGWFTRRPTMDT
jgi:hypothetical protein